MTTGLALGECPVCGCGFQGRTLCDGADWCFCPTHKCKWSHAAKETIGKDAEAEEVRLRNAAYLRDLQEVEPVSDLRECADWKAGNRAEILGWLVADAEAAAEAGILPAPPPPVKVTRNPAGDLEIELPVDDATYAHVMRKYGGQ